MTVNMEDLRQRGSVVPRHCKIQASQLSCCVTARHCGPFVGSCHGNLNLTEVSTQVEGTEAEGRPKLSEICQRRPLFTTWWPTLHFPQQGRCCCDDALVGQACLGMPAVAGPGPIVRIQTAG